ncbi:MAG: glycosyltransferase family 2 protein [Lachnospiraceae bacterium]|nr:glycosyltransferase family 2 protein [Lachnospiraceae bacterium]
MKICACIITYNPGIERLTANVSAVIDQVDSVLIIDNDSRNYNEIFENFYNRKITIIHNFENKGIATALNQAMTWASHQNYSWVLTLDQDSVCSPKLMQRYREYIHFDHVGIITCRIKDRNSHKVTPTSNAIYEFVNTCITSGSLTNVEAFLKVGGFDEKMFIDMVDIDYCYTLKENDYRILRVNYIGLLHELGHSKMHKILFYEFEVTSHSASRKYTIERNSVYLIKKHGLNPINEYFIILLRFFTVIFYEEDKVNKCKMMFKGILAGLKMKP